MFQDTIYVYNISYCIYNISLTVNIFYLKNIDYRENFLTLFTFKYRGLY